MSEFKSQSAFKKAIMGVAIVATAMLSFAGEVQANSPKQNDSIETQRRIALCRKHMEVEGKEVEGLEFEETMDTMQAEPEYVINGSELKGYDTILGAYQGFFKNLENVKFIERLKAPYVSKQAIIFEVDLTAQVKGKPEQKVKLPMMVAFKFNKVGGKIVGENAYFDSAILVQQLTGNK